METGPRDNRSIRARGSSRDDTDDIDVVDAALLSENANGTSGVCSNDIDRLLTQTQETLLKAATIQASAASLSVGEEFKVYFDRVVKPSVDIVYFLSFALQNTAATANIYQANAYGKRGEGKKALDLSYDILEQIEVSVDLLKCSLDCLVEKSKCL